MNAAQTYRLAAQFVVIGLMLAIGASIYGLLPVRIGADAYCGNAFLKADEFSLTIDAQDECATARSPRTALAVSAEGAALVALVSAFYFAVSADVKVRREA